jgi:hypothetical protein
LQAKTDPILLAAERTADGFRSKVTNWAVGYEYPTEITSPGSVPEGASAMVELDEGDGFHYLVVRGFGENQLVAVTVGMTKDGFAPGSAGISGTSLQAKVDPILESVTRTADGFRSKVTNWDGGFAYPTEITSPGSVPEGASAMVELDEGDGFHYLVVRGFAPNTTVDVTVSSTQTGFVSGSAAVTGTSLLAAHTPEFEAVIRTTNGFKAKIKDYGTYHWGATVNQGSPGSADVVTEGLDHYVVVSGLAAGGERSTVTVTATRDDSMPGSAQISGRSILGTLEPSFGDATRLAQSFKFEILNYDDDYTWRASATRGTPVISTETVNDVVHHVVTVTGLLDGEEATVTVWAENLPDVSTSNTKTSSALNGPRVPDLGNPEPTDGGFKVELKNYLDGFSWDYTAPPGSVQRVEEDGKQMLVVTGLGVGVESTLTVTATQNGYLPGEATKLGKSLMAALTPGLDAQVRGQETTRIPINNYDDTYTWSVTQDNGAAVVQGSGNTGAIVVTGLTNGQTVSGTVKARKVGHFDGEVPYSGAALEAPKEFTLGTAVPGNRSFTIPINGYDSDWDWSQTHASVGTATVDATGDTPIVRVTGLDPLQASHVTVIATRVGWIDASVEADGAADVGGQLDPIFIDKTPTADGFTATIDNYDGDFNWDPTSTLGSAEVKSVGGVHKLVVTGVAPDTDVSATVNTTRHNYDNGTATTSSRSLKAAFIATLQNPSRLSGGFTVEIAGYTSRYTWSATVTPSGTATINDQGLVRVTGLQPGQPATLRVMSDRPGYAQGVKQTLVEPLGAALVPQFSPVVGTRDGVTTRVTNYDSAYTWAVTAASGQASIDGSGVVTVTGLSSGQGTSVTVTTNRTDYESGSASASGQAMVEIPDATAPVAPKLTQVVRKGSKAKVTWVAQSFGGSAITNATATCKAGSSKLTASGTAATLTVKKLKSGKKYTCSVTVENIWGSSPASNKIKTKAK